MARLFGTDGVRGLANRDLTAPLAMDLSVAAARVLGEQGAFKGHRPLAVVGRDPRASGELLEAAVVAGLASSGVDVLRLGVLPTPAVAHLTHALDADLGVMLSASHNPAPDNGIKFFDRSGYKLPDEIEDRIEAEIASPSPWQRPTGARIGRVDDLIDGGDHYIQHLVAATPHGLAGVKVVVDCANGAASNVVDAYRQAGAEVVVLNAAPDGLNINDHCGSTHLDVIQAAVIEHGAHVGLAHDGDADRCLAVDATGEVVDGDQIMAILATAMRDAGTLAQQTLVATVMSNLGLRLAMQREGITLVETAVGDRYVLESLRAKGFSLGGEQSGHIILPSHATTGDGVLTGLQLLSRVAETGRSLAELAGVMTMLPQVLLNVTVADKRTAGTHEDVVAAVAAVAAELGAEGRVLLRPSGTEALVRVMVEASTVEQAEAAAHRISDVVRAASPV